MSERLAVGAFVQNKQGKYLLIETQAKIMSSTEKYWDLLRGGVEKGENLLDALKRELKEELGTDKFRNIKNLGMNFSFDFPEEIRKRTGFSSQRVELFFAEFYGNEEDIKIDGTEIIGFIFLDEKDFSKKASWDDTKEYFKKFLEMNV